MHELRPALRYFQQLINNTAVITNVTSHRKLNPVPVTMYVSESQKFHLYKKLASLKKI